MLIQALELHKKPCMQYYFRLLKLLCFFYFYPIIKTPCPDELIFNILTLILMLLSDSLLKLFSYSQDVQILDNNQDKLYYFSSAEVAELADALDSKSSEPRGSCRFDPDLRHHKNLYHRASIWASLYNWSSILFFISKISSNLDVSIFILFIPTIQSLSPSTNRSTAFFPNSAANILSIAEGEPPLWICPSTDTPTSCPTSNFIEEATSLAPHTPSDTIIRVCLLPALWFFISFAIFTRSTSLSGINI